MLEESQERCVGVIKYLQVHEKKQQAARPCQLPLHGFGFRESVKHPSVRARLELNLSQYA
jgi:hypothetical protein